MKIAGITDIRGDTAALSKARSAIAPPEGISTEILAVTGNCDPPEVDACLSKTGIKFSYARLKNSLQDFGIQSISKPV